MDMWEPSKLPKDRHTPAVNLTSARILQLIENVASRNESSNGVRKSSGRNNSSSNKGCFNCGSLDHQVKDCPKPKPTDQQARANRHRNMPKWKITAPKSGESSTKNINGRAFNWCGKCGNWTTTHSTATHTGKSNTNNNKQKTSSSAETNLAAWNPSAWVVEVEKPSPSLSSYQVLMLMAWVLHALTTGWLVYINIDVTALSSLVLTKLMTVPYIDIIDWTKIGIAPMVWFTLGFLTCFATKLIVPFNPVSDLKPPSRQLVRSHQHSINKLNKRKKFKSASSEGLIPKYPLRLRNKQQFNNRSDTPNMKQRELNELMNKMSYVGSTTCNNCNCQHHTNKACLREKERNVSKPENNVIDPNSTCRPFDWDSSNPVTPYNVKNKKGHKKNRRKKAYCSEPKMRNTSSMETRPSLSSVRHVLVMGANLQRLTQSQIADKIALLTPSGFRESITGIKSKRAFQIIWDSGASICVTPDKQDFVDYTPNPDINEVKGLGGKASQVIGQGTVLWSVHDVTGSLRHFQLKAYHIPSSKSRLISTNTLLANYSGEHLTVDSNSMQLSGIENDSTRNAVIAINNPSNNLPTSTAFNQRDTHEPGINLCHLVSTVHKDNTNLSEPQKELLKWHQRLGHLDFKKILHLLRTGVLSNTSAT
jgi:hypothetical protein